jgi:hypothetical protein
MMLVIGFYIRNKFNNFKNFSVLGSIKQIYILYIINVWMGNLQIQLRY